MASDYILFWAIYGDLYCVEEWVVFMNEQPPKPEPPKFLLLITLKLLGLM